MQEAHHKMPRWFMVVSIILLIWNLLGVLAFFQQVSMTEEAIQALSADEQALFARYPLWTKIVFALAVFSGLLGCIGLVLKKKWAKPVFIISLIAIAVQMSHSLFIAGAMEVYGSGAAIMPTLVFLLGVVLIWLADYGVKKEWLQ